MEHISKEIIEYLNLKNIANYKDFDKNIEIKSFEIKNNNNYIIYKDIPISEINILITNSHRIDEEAKKIQELNTLSYYLDKKHVEEYSILQNVFETTSIQEIKDLETIQNSYKLNKPATIKYNKDYLWQIYYISRLNKYYMIVPIQETEQQAFLYVLKNKIENSKKTIYVPICNGTYEDFYLEHGKIKKIENVLYSFTNKWPTIYQSFNKKGETVATVIGKINVIENIMSDYKVQFTNSQSMQEFYNLINALFYLHTELHNYFKFDIVLDENANLHFYFNSFEITNNNLNNFYNNEINNTLNRIEIIEKKQLELKDKLKNLLAQEEKLKAKLTYKQKQISTFLECKKTIFGRFKYFFKNNKKNKEENIPQIETPAEVSTNNNKTEYNLYNYDIEDLIYICKELNKKNADISSIEMDVNSALTRIDILTKKVENANLYLNEIDAHKKSIFEFWKYTNKDEKKQLEEANIINENKKSTTNKSFSIKEDLNDFAKKVDLLQRKEFTEEELNSIYLTTTEVLSDINNIINKKEINTSIYENICKEKEEIQNNIIQHREKARSLKGILKLFQTNTFDNYKLNLIDNIKIIEKALNKCLIDINIQAYCIEEPQNKLCTLELNPSAFLKDNSTINLYKINIPKGTPLIAFTNCIFYSNRNKTLPLGMDYSTKLLIDLRNCNIEKVKEKTNYIIKLSNNNVQKLNITELNI